MGEIKDLFEYIERLEEENKQLRNFIRSAMPTLKAVSQMTQDYINMQYGDTNGNKGTED